MKNNLHIRLAKTDDIKEILALEFAVWGNSMAADRDKWESRLKIFPDGVLVAENHNGLVGVIVSHIINWNYQNGNFPTWGQATANGYITNHSCKGNAMYGVDLAVLPKKPGAAADLLQTAIKNTKERKLDIIMLGCRIPSLKSYVKKNKNIVLNEKIVLERATKDREVQFFCLQGFKVIGVKENYYPPDDDSLGWGVILKLK